MLGITLKTVPRIVMRTCKIVKIKPWINTEDKSNISLCIYTVIVFTRTMKFLAVLTPPSIYQFGARW